MSSNPTYGLNAITLAIAAWLVVVGVHAWTLPRGAFALLRDLPSGRMVAFSSAIFLSLNFFVAGMMIAALHPPMGDSWWSAICRFSAVALFVVLGEIFLLSAYAAMQRIPAAGLVAWAAMLTTASVLTPTMGVTMARAEKRRRERKEQEERELQKTLAENLAVAEGGR